MASSDEGSCTRPLDRTSASSTREASFYKDDKALLDCVDRLSAATTAFRRYLAGEKTKEEIHSAAESAAQLTSKELVHLLANHTTHEQTVIDHQTKLESMRASMMGSEERVHMELITAKLELAEAQSELMSLRGELYHIRKDLQDPDVQAQRAIIEQFTSAEASARRLDSAKAMRKALVSKLEGRNEVLAAHKAKVAKLEQRVKDLDGDW